MSWSCYNGILDADESDLDCGGSCSTKCRYNQKCNSNEDCDAEYSCVENVCASTCGSQKRVLTSSKADTPDIRDHARFNRLCNGDNRQCALRGEEGSGEGVPRGKLWCVRCLDQTGHSILLQAKHSLVAILMHHTRYAPPTPLNWGRTYSRMRLSSALRPRPRRPCTAHDTQYCCLMYSLGRVYSMHQRQNAKGTLVDGGVANISLGRSVHDVSNLETLHGLILAHEPETRTAHLADATTAVGASDGIHVASTLLGTTVVSTEG